MTDSGPPWEIDPHAPYETAKLWLTVEPSLLRRGPGDGYCLADVQRWLIRAHAYAFLNQCIVPQHQTTVGTALEYRVRPNKKMVSDRIDAASAAAFVMRKKQVNDG